MRVERDELASAAGLRAGAGGTCALRGLAGELARARAHRRAREREVAMILSRRELLQAGVSAAALAVGGPVVAAGMRTRPIPRSGEELPGIGMVTGRTFDNSDRAAL